MTEPLTLKIWCNNCSGKGTIYIDGWNDEYCSDCDGEGYTEKVLGISDFTDKSYTLTDAVADASVLKALGSHDNLPDPVNKIESAIISRLRKFYCNEPNKD